ncbi:hypothetical protein ACIRJS_11060 [Streptomyces sp. NPDC102340]|uniref:hypothetical protein n=1 Tax=unclassified Streptomyces TaxID=2593676 RepID=UPI002E2700A1
MARTRISISLEKSKAARIKEHAERVGMDVSAYLVHAATRQMAESDAIEKQFAEVDTLIAGAEAEAEAMHDDPPGTGPELTEEERREVEAALGLVLGEGAQGQRPGHAA